MSMPLINFDEHFADFTSAWAQAHQEDYRTVDAMEEDLPKIYMTFLNTRAGWLGNVTPGSYFTQFEDPKVLVDWMEQYCEEDVPVPDLLLEQITFVGKPCEKRLLRLLENEDAPDEARMIAISLLREMESTLPKMLYINWQLNRNPRDELRDHALESLTEMGEAVVQPILQLFRQANDAGQEALMEVLSHFPGHPQINRLATEMFRRKKTQRALFAGYLARLGAEEALPALLEAAEDPEMSYLTFIEVRNAIEALGGNCPEREFEDDPEYEALWGLDRT